MVCFQNKNPFWGKFWRALEWKMLAYFLVICNILRLFGKFEMLWLFGIFFLVLVYRVKKNLATLVFIF
jgi:hypothetical protein